MMILQNHKVRSRAPEAPSVQTVEIEPAKPKRGRPPGSAAKIEEKIHYPSVCGIDLAKFWKVPAALRNRLASAFARALSEVFGALQKFYDSEAPDLTAVLCHQLPSIVSAIGRATMTELLTEERGHLGQHIRCSRVGCVGTLDYQGDVEKKIKTKMGEIAVARSYYHGDCGHSVCPLDVRLGLSDSHSALPDLLELITLMTTTLSFPEAVAFIEKSISVPISLRYAESVTATDAAYVERKLQQEVEEMMRNPSPAAARNGELEEGVVLVSSDGGFCKVRDHSEPTHEFKMVSMGRLEVKSGHQSDDPEKYSRMFRLEEKCYVGRLAGPDEVFQHAQAEYFRRGYHKVKTIHGVADGASWCLPRIANLAQEDQEVSLVLDWWHAKERVSAAAKLAFPADAGLALQRARVLTDLLWESHNAQFFESLGRLRDEAPTNKAEIQDHIDYFARRRHLLRYKECRARNLPIGSGVIEGGIRFLGKDRLDRSGMSWNIRGADGMLGLRCARYSGRLDELYKTRDLERKTRYETAQRLWLSAA
jgi:hypothetical protein